MDYKFVKSVIRSRVKACYSEINALLAGTADREIQYKYAEVAGQLPAMKALYTCGPACAGSGAAWTLRAARSS